MATAFEARRSVVGRLASLAIAILGAALFGWSIYIYPDWGSRGAVGMFFAGGGLLCVGLWQAITPIGNMAILSIDEEGVFDRRIMVRRAKWKEVLALTERADYRGKAVDIQVSIPESLSKSSFTRTFESWDQAGVARIVLTGLDQSAENIRAVLLEKLDRSRNLRAL
jgi:hypothetical protein